MQMKFFIFSVFLITILNAERPLPKYDINLDLPPQERFKQVATDFKEKLNDFRNYLLGEIGLLIYPLKMITYIRSEDKELMGELEGISQVTDINVREIQFMNWLYEYSIIRTYPLFLEKSEKQFLNKNCIGLIAKDTNNGTIYHGRNLDFDWSNKLATLLYDAVFYKNGKEVFRSTQFIGFQGFLTSMKSGAFAVSEDTRFAQKNMDNFEMFYHLVTGRTLNTWSIRKIIEESNEFDEVVDRLSKVPYTSNQYNIISGVSGNQGVILARSPQGVTHRQQLDNNTNYIIITNYDFWNNDPEEAQDPRRIVADNYMKQQTVINDQTVFNAISLEGVKVGDTAFQALMSAHSGLYNTTSQYPA